MQLIDKNGNVFGGGIEITGPDGKPKTTGGLTVWGSITGTLSSQTDLQTALNGKQATLISATNIKTINGNSILGSGDLTVGGSGLTVGTTAITSGTIGRVLFQGTGNVLQQSANLFWDNTNNRLGIGTSSPSFSLDVNGGLRTLGVSQLRGPSNSILGSNLQTTSAALIFNNTFNGALGIGSYSNSGAEIQSAQNGGVSVGGILILQRQAGNTLIGTATDAGFKLDVNGTARVQGTMTIPSTGNFGITVSRTGTSGIAQQIYNSTGTTYLGADSSGGGFLFTGGLPYASFFGNGANRPTQFGTNGAIRMTIFAGGNVAIGTTTDVASAILQASSTTQGFLPPRMTNAQMLAIATPAAGLVVYDTTNNKHCGYNGTAWQNFY